MRRAQHVLVPAGLDCCWCLLDYEGDARSLVRAIKYRNDRRALAWLADGMAGLLVPPEGSVVTWAPTTRAHRRERGFDQAELLARAVARRWSRRCVRLLVRSSGLSQTGRGRSERLGSVTFSSHRRRPVSVPVVVVDDVMTTGATLAGAAEALKAAGAPWVGAVTAARTP